MSLTFAIADLHGRFDLLEKAFAAIIENAPAGDVHTIVTMGDYIDRGPQSKQVLDLLMTFDPGPDFKLICLKGNHEDIMLQCCVRPKLAGWWIGNGGGATLISFGHPIDAPCDTSVVPQEYLRWAFERPRFHEDAHRVFVHAGARQGIPLSDQSDETLLWMLYPGGSEDGYDGKHLVHGHEQFADGPHCFANRTDLDTFAWYTGRLVVGVFDDDIPGGPIDFIEVRGPTIKEFREASK